VAYGLEHDEVNTTWYFLASSNGIDTSYYYHHHHRLLNGEINVNVYPLRSVTMAIHNARLARIINLKLYECSLRT